MNKKILQVTTNTVENLYNLVERARRIDAINSSKRTEHPRLYEKGQLIKNVGMTEKLLELQEKMKRK